MRNAPRVSRVAGHRDLLTTGEALALDHHHVQFSSAGFRATPPLQEAARARSSVWENLPLVDENDDDGDSFARIVFVTRIFTMCPEQIGVAPLSRTLASRTLVMPRSCLVNNCLIFSPSLLGALPLAPSYVLIHSFASLFRGPDGLGLYERLKNRSNCALVLRDDKCRKRARALRRRKRQELLPKQMERTTRIMPAAFSASSSVTNIRAIVRFYCRRTR